MCVWLVVLTVAGASLADAPAGEHLLVARGPTIPQDSLVVLYNAGNAAYREGRFSDAATAYEAAIALGARNSAVHYNLGNACFRLGQTGRAIVAYERSLRLNPRNDDAMKNLEFASLLVTDRIQEEDVEVRVQEAIKRTLGLIAPKWLAGGITVGLTGVCLIGAWWLLGARPRGFTTTLFVLSGFVLVGSIGVVGTQRWVSGGHDEAIVVASQSEVRFEPSSGAKVAFVVHEGTKVWVERDDGDWTLVRVANGLRGWLPREVIMTI